MVICVDSSIIPTTTSTVTTTTATLATITTTKISTCESFCIPGCNKLYTVKPGEYPSQIAIDQGIPYSNLLIINNNFGNQYTGNFHSL